MHGPLNVKFVYQPLHVYYITFFGSNIFSMAHRP